MNKNDLAIALEYAIEGISIAEALRIADVVDAYITVRIHEQDEWAEDLNEWSAEEARDE